VLTTSVEDAVNAFVLALAQSCGSVPSQDKHEKRRSGDLPIATPLSWQARWLVHWSIVNIIGPWKCGAVDRWPASRTAY
jgi:hypothetical protein